MAHLQAAPRWLLGGAGLDLPGSASMGLGSRGQSPWWGFETLQHQMPPLFFFVLAVAVVF